MTEGLRFILIVFIFFIATFILPSALCVSNPNTTCNKRFYFNRPTNVCQVRDPVNTSESTDDFADNLPKEFRKLPRIDPIKVGFTRQIQSRGKNYSMKTLSMKPPIFEIQDFLSSDECDHIIDMAKTVGMETSETIWKEYDDVLNNGDLYPVFKKLDADDNDALDYFELAQGVQGIKDVQMELEDVKEMFKHFELDFFDDESISFSEFQMLTSPDVFDGVKSYLGNLEMKKSEVKSRQSFSAFLDPITNSNQIEFFDKLYNRIAAVTKLPIEMIRGSEALQVIKYEVSGHYHAHHDSEDSEYAPCCHLVHDNEICRPCRYATMFYYLNEPAEGGGTAFPFADNETYDDTKTNREEKHRLNLSSHCDKANLMYKPRKGTALFWYNHVIDDQTGWVGNLDEMSYHGGCDVIQGVKWAANNWLNAQSDREKDWELWRIFGDS